MVQAGRLPIVSHHEVEPSAAQFRRVAQLAAALEHEQPSLVPQPWIRQLSVSRIGDGGVLHLDDLDEIPLLDRFYDARFLQDRARLRAGEQDVVASCATADPAFERYCEEELGLGAVTWLRPQPSDRPLRLARACWRDHRVRAALQRAVRTGRLRYLHPHLAGFHVWALAHLLRATTGGSIGVIGPPPVLARAVNNKLWFARVITRLFDDQLIPPTASASGWSGLARLVKMFANRSPRIVIKIPEAAGGTGNLVLRAKTYRGRRLGAVRARLKKRLRDFAWHGEHPLLVGAWESEVLRAPSAQLWIPPFATAQPPVVEGLFEQVIQGKGGYFVGAAPANLPDVTATEIALRCVLVGRLLQRLGYVGRCSFDLILVGRDMGSCRIRFVECNGRWGATSAPMTLMNRLFGDFASRPYATRVVEQRGMERFTFANLLAGFDDRVFDVRTGRGDLIFYNPGALQARPGIDLLVMGESWEVARKRAFQDIPQQIMRLIRPVPQSITAALR